VVVNDPTQPPQTGLTDDSIVALATHCPQLENIVMSGLRVRVDSLDATQSTLTDLSVRALAAHFTQLDRATFDNCDRMSTDCVLAVAEHCPRLRLVEFRNSVTVGDLRLCAEANDSGIHSRIHSCEFTRVPSAPGVLAVADMEVLARACPLLTNLTVDPYPSSPSSRVTTGAIAAITQGCPLLECVSIGNCEDSTLCVASLLQHCPKITRATVGDISWTVNNSWAISASIDVRGNDATDASVEAIARACPAVAELTVKDGAQLTDHALVAVSTHCINLTEVDLRGCDAVTDRGFVALAKSCQQLKSVKIERCPSIGPLSVRELGNHSRRLELLELTTCVGLTDVDVEMFSQGCSELQHVDFGRCELLTMRSASTLMERCPKLSYANIAGQTWSVGHSTVYLRGGETTDAIAAMWASRVVNATALTIQQCPLLTDDAIISMSRTWKGLLNVQLIECAALTDAAVDTLVSNCVNLGMIDFSNCPGLTARSAQARKQLETRRFVNAMNSGRVRMRYDDDDSDDDIFGNFLYNIRVPGDRPFY
jgi:hypothetical protein